jgi:glycine/sarcosine N-methyltransferase
MDFYDEIADFYDEMTRFHARFDSEEQMLIKWQSHYRFQSALDSACGTGLHAILLARMGIAVTASDISEKMLVKARENAVAAQTKVTWIKASLQNLAGVIQDKFDVVFCLGNSLPHVLDADELRQVLSSFRFLLNPTGHIVIQMLNYHKILSGQDRIVAIQRHGNHEFVRFYDFITDRLRFNVLAITWHGNTASHSLSSTLLHPYQWQELETPLASCGFTHTELYGDMNFTPFDREKSANLVIVAS